MLKNHSLFEKVLIVVILLTTLFFSTYKLTESPPVWYDEGFYNQVAVNVYEQGVYGLRISPSEFASASSVTVGYPLIYPVSLSFKYFGIGVTQGRAVMVLFLLSLVAIAYFLVKNLFGYKIALLSTILLSSFPVLYGNGKSVLGEIPGLFFLFLFLFYLNKIEKSNYKNRSDYIFAGISAGLCVVTKPIFLVLLPAILLATLFNIKKIQFYWKYILISFIFFLVPITIWLSTQFSGGDSLLSTLTYYANPYEVTNLFSIIWSNFLRFFTETSPAYMFILFVIWTISFWIRKINNHKISLTESVSFWFAVLVILFYLRTVGWYRYFFPANVVTILFIPFAVYIILDYIKVKFKLLKNININILSSVFILLLFIMQVYQLTANSWVASYYNNNKTEELEKYFSNFKPDTKVFLYNVPEVAIFLPFSSYYQYLKPTNSLTIGEKQLKKISSGVPDKIIISGDMFEEDREIFTLYEIKGKVKKYVILEKK